MEKINKLTVNGQSYVLSDSETAKGLTQEISARQTADETVLQTAKAYTDTATGSLPTKEYVDTGLNMVHSNAMKAVNILGGRVDALEGGYRHIFTIQCQEDIKQIDITQDSEGNGFACSEFVVFATSAPKADNQPHLYIGAPAWYWISSDSGFFSTTEQRVFRMHLKHIGGGWWRYDAVRSTLGAENATPDTRGNIRSLYQLSEKLNNISFWANKIIPAGSSFEVYGK